MKKAGYFFLSFLPLILTVMLQTILSIPMMGISLLRILLTNKLTGNTTDYIDMMNRLVDTLTNQDFTALLSVLYALSGLFIFGFWYAKQFHISMKVHPKKFLSFPIIAGIILLVPALQILTSFLTSFVASIFPHWMEYYEKLIETAGLTGSPGFLMILYAVILGPIEEELTFRGVTMQAAKRAMPFWAANVLQAVLFGVFHMNMIQGIYAFFIGLFCGYICEKGGSIYLSILLHILFNAWGTFMTADMGFANTPIGGAVLMIGAIFAGLIGLRVFLKGTQKIREVDM